ncbi:pyridoxamine 5'-phosphate oxidase family protein [Corynebacterium diphtheriae]|uniref:pyridoxamine 5'-phosphate oxidase family protein n=1 Tax=Corynebacterium diphtheriae TaxID=1717 RepID=UPI0018CB8B8D|nr:pyridoxamine 5'-phosphate oxidase family protein [Corynebacterium diphtheriae]MBG9290927.1 pyridoxamine 5'-phosphate oxidase family protein [Corynebacterium diphtheriae bv. gravis]
MMGIMSDPITILDSSDSLSRLSSESVGRLVVHRKDDLDIFPVNFVLDYSAEQPRVYFRTAEGTKLFSVNLNSDVLFEVDRFDDAEGWSVVLKGNAYVVRDTEEARHADTLGLKPWLPTLKYNFVRIDVREVSGRAFVFGEEPKRY